jgi:hypothetical protein
VSAGNGPRTSQPRALRITHRRIDFLGFFATSEQAVFTRMRIDAADTDARTRDAGANQHLVGARNDAFHQRRIDAFDGVQQADVRGHVDDAQLRRHQHHGHLRRAGERGQQLGVAGVLVAGSVQRLLAEWRRADGTRRARLDDAHGTLDVAKRRLARHWRHRAERQILGHEVQVDAFDVAVPIGGLARVIEAFDVQAAVDDPARGAQPLGVAHHQRTAYRAHVRATPALS